MCLALPGRIVEICPDDGQELFRMAVVDFGGVRRRICLNTIDPADAVPGRYVVAHAGVAISVLDPDQAIAVIEDLRAMADHRDRIENNLT